MGRRRGRDASHVSPLSIILGLPQRGGGCNEAVTASSCGGEGRGGSPGTTYCESSTPVPATVLASSGRISACENPGVTPPGIETGSPWWDVSSLTAQPPRPRMYFEMQSFPIKRSPRPRSERVEGKDIVWRQRDWQGMEGFAPLGALSCKVRVRGTQVACGPLLGLTSRDDDEAFDALDIFAITAASLPGLRKDQSLALRGDGAFDARGNFAVSNAEENQETATPLPPRDHKAWIRPTSQRQLKAVNVNGDWPTTEPLYGGATVAERLDCSSPSKAIRAQFPAGPFRIFACGNRAGRCRWSAGLPGDLSFPPPPHSGAPPYLNHPQRLSRPRSRCIPSRKPASHLDVELELRFWQQQPKGMVRDSHRLTCLRVCRVRFATSVKAVWSGVLLGVDANLLYCVSVPLLKAVHECLFRTMNSCIALLDKVTSTSLEISLVCMSFSDGLDQLSHGHRLKSFNVLNPNRFSKDVQLFVLISVKWTCREVWLATLDQDGTRRYVFRWTSRHCAPRCRALASSLEPLALKYGDTLRLLASHLGEPGSIPGGVPPDFRTWESCRTMPLVGVFSRGSPVSHALSFRRCPILISLHSQGPDAPLHYALFHHQLLEPLWFLVRVKNSLSPLMFRRRSCGSSFQPWTKDEADRLFAFCACTQHRPTLNEHNCQSHMVNSDENVLAEKQFNLGTRRLVVRSQRDRSTSSLVYGLSSEEISINAGNDLAKKNANGVGERRRELRLL
ncbi:hypothetical protein PR048_017637 [Dryococelus australis]|uniref:Uncharacterized protein n=1 Tax=Dryococelus australis TaxID=614101 RepID=A0ABQ9HA57_9NEOP|nr:hypothetical protein PR048_017637 [Dryococelus australis]